MITDRPRASAYAQALRGAVSPGCTVLDIGAGTGFFSLLACKFGASRVYAVDVNDAIEVAKAMAADNGGTEAIVFLQKLSTAVELSPAADVIVSDLRGVLPLMEQHIPSIVDARSRLLAAGGRLIPRSDTIWAALVEDAEGYRRYEEPWLRNDFDVDMRAGQEFVTNRWRRVDLERDRLLVQPEVWAHLDYQTVEDPDVVGSLSWVLDRAGTVHGLAAWFDTELDDVNGFSNAPGEPALIYGQAFFPWGRPVAVEPGDAVTVELSARLIGDDYIWSWSLDLQPAVGSDRRAVTLRQSTFRGAPLSPSGLRRRAAGHTPALGTEGVIDRYLLAAMDGSTSLEVIARNAAAEFPEDFSTWGEALARAGELSAKYGS
jgi:protein arginine N-methyltransferase 1